MFHQIFNIKSYSLRIWQRGNAKYSHNKSNYSNDLSHCYLKQAMLN